jgi:hypothetical protein
MTIEFLRTRCFITLFSWVFYKSGSAERDLQVFAEHRCSEVQRIATSAAMLLCSRPPWGRDLKRLKAFDKIVDEICAAYPNADYATPYNWKSRMRQRFVHEPVMQYGRRACLWRDEFQVLYTK